MWEELNRLLYKQTAAGKVAENNCIELSVKLSVSRTQISRWLNEEAAKKRLVKINGKPVLYASVKWLKTLFSESEIPESFASIQEYQKWIEKSSEKDFEKMVGYDLSLRQACDLCKSGIGYPPNGLPVLLLGETGTGKSLMAKLTWEYGINHRILNEDAPFVHVNCSDYANNPELLTANLFGYAKGAFTGALEDHEGFLSAADKGILFLDEVHCLPPQGQEKLFLFMDTGTFRRLGDSKTICTSSAKLIFATTESPSEVLRKQLLRRIPVIVELPNLEHRGVLEKTALLCRALEQEQTGLGQNIKISIAAVEILLHRVFAGNVGEQNNTVKLSCMNALHRSRGKESILILPIDLPKNVLESSFSAGGLSKSWKRNVLSPAELKEKAAEGDERVSLVTKMMEYTNDHNLGNLKERDFLQSCENELSSYMASRYLWKKEEETESFPLRIIRKTVVETTERYGYLLPKGKENQLAFLLLDAYEGALSFEGFYKKNERQCNAFTDLVEKMHPREMALVHEMADFISSQLDYYASPCIQAVVSVALQYYRDNQILSSRVGIIVAHGASTARSIAQAVNQMLGQYVFDGLDMPLNTTSLQITEKINSYLKQRKLYREVLILVDMGSLETIVNELALGTDVSLILINSVSTQLALAAGNGLRNGDSLEKIGEEARKMHPTVIQRKTKTRKKVVLCSCPTGLGTSEKLKRIIENSLPSQTPIQVLAVDYSRLTTPEEKERYMDEYEIICIVGTMDPDLPKVRFVPLEQLIANDSFEILTDCFHGLIEENELRQVEKNILKNFSLSNIIGNLTILNPDKLLEHVANAIDNLQESLGMTFHTNTCFGLYVHVCCMVERLVTKQEVYSMAEPVISYQKLAEFAQKVKKSFSGVEKYYGVDIPKEEIEFIYLYIQSFQAS